ncbi:hypothetical protein CPB83DRAFT_900371 [Crepidotus variabilis]|uniref:Uncharacterized protein n=1 Tax=Crepidotus variabilis TaxID=179855 RepID=A0A9P6E393_9AGAR|nr:hypothetical protein CPB83DRAFT_900371 [Crepidotus variabilis]
MSYVYNNEQAPLGRRSPSDDITRSSPQVVKEHTYHNQARQLVTVYTPTTGSIYWSVEGFNDGMPFSTINSPTGWSDAIRPAPYVRLYFDDRAPGWMAWTPKGARLPGTIIVNWINNDGRWVTRYTNPAGTDFWRVGGCFANHAFDAIKAPPGWQDAI